MFSLTFQINIISNYFFQCYDKCIRGASFFLSFSFSKLFLRLRSASKLRKVEKGRDPFYSLVEVHPFFTKIFCLIYHGMGMMLSYCFVYNCLEIFISVFSGEKGEKKEEHGSDQMGIFFDVFFPVDKKMVACLFLLLKN